MKRYLFATIPALLLGLSCSAASQQAAESDVQTSDTTAVAAAPAAAELSEDELWDKSNTAYVNGDYHAAAEGYTAILGRGRHSAKLYNNLANALFKTGRLGQAILYYRRALRLDPGNDDIRYNLESAEERTKDNIESVPGFFLADKVRSIRNTMSSTSWAVLSLVALAAMLACAATYLLSSRLGRRKAGFYGMLGCALLFAVSTAFSNAGRKEAAGRTEAIVMGQSVPVKSSPDNSATDLFVLHEGTAVRITESSDEWCEIVIADGKKGWVRARRIEII